MRDLLLFLVLLPRNAGVLLIRGYRAAISPLYGDVCRYYPSCSAYGLGAVQQRGLVLGSALAAWRILRCNPWSAGGVDDVTPARHDRYRLTAFGWVVPAGWSSVAPEPRSHEHEHEHEHEHAHASGAAAGFRDLSSPELSRKA